MIYNILLILILQNLDTIFAEGGAMDKVSCEVNRSVAGKSQLLYKNCPGEGDPPDHVACCYFTLNETRSEGDLWDPSDIEDLTGLKCCPLDQSDLLLSFISDGIALLIAVSCTIIIFVFAVIIAICCFWSRCPLYMMCSIKYRKEDIIAYHSKEDDGLHLPSEELHGVSTYEPNAVKVTQKEECYE